jgi:isoquinoline 1-oxidoreductase beta subunit
VEGGRIAAWDARIAVPSVGTSFQGRNMPMFGTRADAPNAAAIEGADDNPYGIESFRAAHVPVAQPVPLGYWRSVGHSFTAFFVESFVDELALAARADPVLFRLGMLKDRPRHAAVLRAVAERAVWGDAPARGMARGVALHESFGSIVGMVVEAGVRDGAVVLGRVTSAIDCGRAINPDSVRAQVEGGAIFGLAAALHEKIEWEDGRPTATNFDAYPLLRFDESPLFDTLIVESGEALGGVGEPGTPPAAPALANALARATGRRARSLPLSDFYTA